MSFIGIVLGAILVLWGADRLTAGASALARRFRINELVIGLTIVAFGTSLPEFIISFTAAIQGSSDISVGNIVGSNIFNTLVIVGATAAVTPICVSRGTLYKDIPFALLSSVALIALSLDGVFGHISPNQITRGDGIVLLLFFCVFMAYTFSLAKQDDPDAGDVPHATSYLRIFLLLIVGIACLIGGGKLFVNSAVDIAYRFGISESVVGLTLVAGGTSLPELATSVVAARKGSSAIAIGNVIGSNLFNVFFVTGVCTTISPVVVNGISTLDLFMLLFSMLLLWGFAVTKRTVERWEGVALLAVYGFYLYELLAA